MRRAHAVLVLAAVLGLAAAGPLAAQSAVRFYLGNSPGDTSAGLTTGGTGSLPVRMLNPFAYGYPYYYVTHVRLTVHFDPARLAVDGAVAVSAGLSTVNQVTVGSGVATISASGFVYGLDTPALRLLAHLLPGATDGAYVWMTADSVVYYAYYYGTSGPLPGGANIGRTCHATQTWGDVDASGQVDSRDALITLSAAVGLPVSGFDLAHGDVDGDGLANSRDALMMLSHAIGLVPGGATGVDRTGVGLTDACPGLTAPGETVVFRRSGGAGDGLYRLDSLSAAPVQLTSVASDMRPKLDPAGTSVAFECADSTLNTQICRMDASGANRRLITGPGPIARHHLDWSPDGTRIAYLQTFGDLIYTMDSSGTNQAEVSTVTGADVAWTRDGTGLTYSSGGIWTITLADSSIATTLSGWPVNPPLRWSPDGSTIAFLLNDTFVYTVPSGGGTPAPVVPFDASAGGFDWGPQGLLVAMPDEFGVMSLWLFQGGPNGPLVRLTDPGAGTSDGQPSFRRNP